MIDPRIPVDSVWRLKRNRGLPTLWRVTAPVEHYGFVELVRDIDNGGRGPQQKRVRPSTLLGDYQRVDEGRR